MKSRFAVFDPQNRSSSHFQPQQWAESTLQIRTQTLFWGKNRAKMETCGCGCHLCGSSEKNGTGWSPTITSCPPVWPDEALFKRIKPIQWTFHEIKEISLNGSSRVFAAVWLWHKPVEHLLSAALITQGLYLDQLEWRSPPRGFKPTGKVQKTSCHEMKHSCASL